jgi:hypothetical protein
MCIVGFVIFSLLSFINEKCRIKALRSTLHRCEVKQDNDQPEVLMATNMNTAVFWGVAPCSIVDTGRRFSRTYCLRHQVDKW